MKKPRPTFAEVRRQALEEARADVRADILLDRAGYDWLPSTVALDLVLDRVSKSLDQLIEKTA